jgi:uncharacterized protein (TIGR02145 family)
VSVNGSFISILTDLNRNTLYYVRAYASNNAGTSYGDQVSFTTCGVLDIDCNCYKTVIIGSQEWMAENLRTSKLNDGTPITNVTDNIEWSTSVICDPGNPGYCIHQGIIAYCWYENSSTYDNTYGKLYNYLAVNSEKLCPTGWHVPTAGEWAILKWPYDIFWSADSCGIIGADLMEVGTSHWNNPHIIGTNETGFTALPGGRRDADGTFTGMTIYGEYWTYFEFANHLESIFYPIPITCHYADTPSKKLRSMRTGLSIRCIKDQ